MMRQFLITAVTAIGAASAISSHAIADDVTVEIPGSEALSEIVVTPESAVNPEEAEHDSAISVDQVYYPYMCSSTDSAGQHWWGGSDKSNSAAKRSALAKCRRGSSNPSTCRIESCD
jgi:opacity protein-like surface antigen